MALYCIIAIFHLKLEVSFVFSRNWIRTAVEIYRNVVLAVIFTVRVRNSVKMPTNGVQKPE